MKRVFTILTTPVITAALGLSLTACGATNGDSRPSSPSPSTGHGTMRSGGRMSSGAHNASDVMFAQMMIPHHRQAVEMAEIAASRASKPEVKKLAARIKQAQAPEIEQMTGWLRAWGAPMSADTAHMGHGMPGMVSAEQMTRLRGTSGTAFDKLFLELMIGHHEGALSMARTEQAEGASPDAKALAASILSTQSAEITTMRALAKTV